MYPPDIVIEALPPAIREQVNHRLRNGQSDQQVVQWLNTLPKVKRLMAAQFDGIPINEEHLSCWMSNGFRSWAVQQETLDAAVQFRQNAAEIAQASGGLLADQLALCLTARVALALRDTASDAEPLEMQSQKVRQFSADVVALRKGDQEAQWLKIEREKLDSKLKKFRKEETARRKKWEKPKIDLNTHLPPEVRAQVEAELRRM